MSFKSNHVLIHKEQIEPCPHVKFKSNHVLIREKLAIEPCPHVKFKSNHGDASISVKSDEVINYSGQIVNYFNYPATSLKTVRQETSPVEVGSYFSGQINKYWKSGEVINSNLNQVNNNRFSGDIISNNVFSSFPTLSSAQLHPGDQLSTLI